jgi:hypothetical protein
MARYKLTDFEWKTIRPLPPACNAGADGRRMSEIVGPVRPHWAPGT